MNVQVVKCVNKTKLNRIKVMVLTVLSLYASSANLTKNKIRKICGNAWNQLRRYNYHSFYTKYALLSKPRSLNCIKECEMAGVNPFYLLLWRSERPIFKRMKIVLEGILSPVDFPVRVIKSVFFIRECITFFHWINTFDFFSLCRIL